MRLHEPRPYSCSPYGESCCSCKLTIQALFNASHGLQLQSLWGVPAAAVG